MSCRRIRDGHLYTERSHHMKGICHQRQRAHGHADSQFQDEEDGIDGQHDRDARRLGPRHGDEDVDKGYPTDVPVYQLSWMLLDVDG